MSCMKSIAAFRSVLVSLSSVAVVAVMGVAAPAAGAATPTPSPSCSPGPNGFGIAASPTRIDSGQSVTLTVTYYQCGGGPEHHFTVTARPLGQNSPITTAGHVTTPAGETESASLTLTPDRGTTYMVTEDGQTYSQPPSVGVTVDRTAGSCSGVLDLRAPATARAGSTVAVTGMTSDTSTVSILFRKRGQTAFQVRRSLTPAADGTFSTSFTADDDYRLYAATSRCDSPPVLVPATPTVAGPATAARNRTVKVLVRAAAGVPISLYFHRIGTTGYALARRGTTVANGTYTATYKATADYRYYAVTGPDSRRSNVALTRVR
ncbi:MAG: hypothetical protein JWP11_1238 [Frankiales bacterium]|nr:hypothetical protein [Frankiales bacterium]